MYKTIISGILLAVTSTYALANQEKYIKFEITLTKDYERVLSNISKEFKNIRPEEKEKALNQCYEYMMSEDGRKFFKRESGSQKRKILYICNVKL
ncbi:hypothetical protein [Acinetobacter higginsii]|uniref:hypothetical protein n=1 Tax=Acinetobacter higginsii TaxID=70347 RepID=UPI001F4A9AC7|nr:hypothetical protein [Acinetobacter higginsii]MCH7382182.1 hypothetical protein [Acinetobacter higginsii]